MVIHWESSRRPMYIRTVWKDGQHHVVLDKTKEILQEESPSFRKGLPATTQRTTKSAGSLNFNVSSVRVLLTGVKRFRNCKDFREKSLERPKTWNSSTYHRQATCRNLNNEVNFEAIRGFKPPIVTKPLEVSFLEERQFKVLENSLSEKVMVWLDLANHQDSQIEKLGANLEMFQSEEIILEKKTCDVDNILESSVLKNQTPREEKTETLVIYSSEELQTVDNEHFYHVLTPRTRSEEYEDDVKPNYERRQLHIFMPNLPSKKFSDCDSSLLSSSKSSFKFK